MNYPEVEKAIIKHLNALRDTGATLTLVTIHAIVIAMISDMAPEIFKKQGSDGSHFHCSDSFLHEWLHTTRDWSECCATWAAQKTPVNWEDTCEQAFLRLAYMMKEEHIPTPLYVNSDQTQVVYAQGSSLTWAKTGSKQVSTIGNDEKCAFTVVVSISNDGTMLPLQAIYQGSTKGLCPSMSLDRYNDSLNAGFRFEFSNTETYWSTHETMHDLVDNIIAPYFNKKKRELGLPLHFERPKCCMALGCICTINKPAIVKKVSNYACLMIWLELTHHRCLKCVGCKGLTCCTRV
jgi:hypothetical protein